MKIGTQHFGPPLVENVRKMLLEAFVDIGMVVVCVVTARRDDDFVAKDLALKKIGTENNSLDKCKPIGAYALSWVA